MATRRPTPELSTKPELPLRVRVLGPLRDVACCVQRGKDDLVPPVHDTEAELVFELGLRVGAPRADGAPNLLGPFAQVPPAGRFLYVCWGTLAGQSDSCWTRRAKVPLTAITPSMIEAVLASGNSILEARIGGLSKDGGPACAAVPLLGGGWTVARS
jgi:uncharacterized protein DUF5990